MMTVLIRDYYLLYQYGMKAFLRWLLSEKYGESAIFIEDFSDNNVACADIIVVDLCAGEYFTCLYELRMAANALIICVVDKEVSLAEPQPACLRNIVMILRDEPLHLSCEKIIHAMENRVCSPLPLSVMNCYGCRRKAIAFQKLQVIEEIYKGKQISQIAADMNVSDKTVYAHKYLFMRKFFLDNDYELFTLLKRLHNKNPLPPITNKPSSIDDGNQ